ncbi:MAG: hypothetical protein R3183_03545 [Oleiphilaceae bacterium]|nr:hypothetical protein [Oleiphilaceae bacterium]
MKLSAYTRTNPEINQKSAWPRLRQTIPSFSYLRPGFNKPDCREPLDAASPAPTPDTVRTFYLAKYQLSIDIEIFDQPAQKPHATQQSLINKIADITRLAWEDFGEVVQSWFEWASVLVLVRVEGKIVGFNACTFEDDRVALYLASFVLPEYQSVGISKIMQNMMIKKMLYQRGLRRFFEPVWFTFRTQNPRVVQRVMRYRAAPCVKGTPASEQERNIARGVAQRFSPHCEFDDQHFVLKGALKDKPDLLQSEKIFYSGNPTVDTFCQQHLKYEEQNGNLFICVGRFNWIQQLYFWLMY